IVADGQTGFLLEPGDYPSLALRLDQLVTDTGLREKMGTAALDRAREKFDCRTNLGRILEMMKAED
ncbi:MAG: glycosyl transferase family 1, partial [Armatimonadota bacterium]|nr:glycosyl transferase family 1 [Armatimonadota bacterium]